MENVETYEAVHKYASRLLKDPVQGQDVVQEVFLRLSAYKGEILNERAWLYRTARNLVIDIFRKAGRIKMENGVESLPDDATRFCPKRLAEEKEQSEMLQEKIDELSPRHREALRLKFQEGLKYAEIAEIMNETVPNVGWLLHEAIGQLRKRLGA